MDNTPLALTGFGFWLAMAVIVVAIIWAIVKNQQMKHELKMKLLDKGQDLDPSLLAKLLAADAAGARAQPKSVAEQQREGSGLVGLIFMIAGLVFAFNAIVRHPDPSWPLLSLGAFSFAFGWLCWIMAGKEYERAKAEEKQSRN